VAGLWTNVRSVARGKRWGDQLPGEGGRMGVGQETHPCLVTPKSAIEVDDEPSGARKELEQSDP
jgi:hypothetical protein